MAILQSDGVENTSDLILKRNGTEGLRLTSTTVQISSVNDGQLAGNRNKIINGAMEIAQRGTSFAAVNDYTLDRFMFTSGGSTAGGVATVTQSTDAPNDTFQYSLKVDVTTADTSIAAGDYAHIIQKIEGFNVRDLIGQTFTLSFWVKSPKTGTHCVSFKNGSINRSFVMEYTISVANTWEYKNITVTGGLITAGTWNWTNGVGLEVLFILAAGTTYQTTVGAWQTGNFIRGANQVNVMDSTANDFFLTGVQLEIGSKATPFERRPIGTELTLCQRYFEKSYNINTAPGTNTGLAASIEEFATASERPSRVRFAVSKRDSPSTVVYDAVGNSGYVTTFTPGQNNFQVPTANDNQGTSGFKVFMTQAGLIRITFHWTAISEL